MGRFKVAFLSAFMVMSLARPAVAADSASREFMMSCTYGVLAGTLVGTAMLAFTDQPGENLSKVARGASIGLYTGILLGLYVVYGVPDGEEVDPNLMNGPSEAWRAPRSRATWAIAPTFAGRRIEGMHLAGEIFSF